MISKRDSLCLLKGVELRWIDTKGRALRQGRLKIYTSFAILSLGHPISSSYRTRKLGMINAMEMLQNQVDLETDCKICPAKGVPWSLWSSKVIPQVWEIFPRAC